jgi:hypothetical protein
LPYIKIPENNKETYKNKDDDGSGGGDNTTFT